MRIAAQRSRPLRAWNELGSREPESQLPNPVERRRPKPKHRRADRKDQDPCTGDTEAPQQVAKSSLPHPRQGVPGRQSDGGEPALLLLRRGRPRAGVEEAEKSDRDTFRGETFAEPREKLVQQWQAHRGGQQTVGDDAHRGASTSPEDGVGSGGGEGRPGHPCRGGGDLRAPAAAPSTRLDPQPEDSKRGLGRFRPRDEGLALLRDRQLVRIGEVSTGGGLGRAVPRVQPARGIRGVLRFRQVQQVDVEEQDGQREPGQ